MAAVRKKKLRVYCLLSVRSEMYCIVLYCIDVESELSRSGLDKLNKHIGPVHQLIRF